MPQKVSIIIPAYNEEAFIGQLLEVILAVDIASLGFDREIIVVNNGSHDKTGEIASKFKQVTCLTIKKNRGKGEGVKYGISQATGDWILIQDADLEYDPNDYIPMLKAIQAHDQLVSIYGSRTLGQKQGKKGLLASKHPGQSLGPWLANIVLSVWAFILYGRYITDTLTGYKIYPAKILKQFTIQTFGFETDHELTAKLLRSGVKIIEVLVSYRPRSLKEGKKIKSKDFFVAMWTFLKFRFVPKKDF